METSSGKGSGMDPVANTTSFDVVIIGAGLLPGEIVISDGDRAREGRVFLW